MVLKGVLRLVAVLGLCALVLGCSSQKKTEFKVEYYQPAYRQLPPEPVYNRVMYSHLPQPLPAAAKTKAPFLKPDLEFSFVDTPFHEAVGAVAQTMGYELQYPRGLEAGNITLEMVGPPEKILAELSSQARVITELDHADRVLRVYRRAGMTVRRK